MYKVKIRFCFCDANRLCPLKLCYKLTFFWFSHQAGFTLGNVVGMYLAQNYDVSLLKITLNSKTVSSLIRLHYYAPPPGDSSHGEWDGAFSSRCKLIKVCCLLTGLIVFTGSKHCKEIRRLQERRGGQEEASRVNSSGPCCNSFRDWLDQRNLFLSCGAKTMDLFKGSSPSGLYKNIMCAWNSSSSSLLAWNIKSFDLWNILCKMYLTGICSAGAVGITRFYGTVGWVLCFYQLSQYCVSQKTKNQTTKT